jgi:hypothetical protein
MENKNNFNENFDKEDYEFPSNMDKKATNKADEGSLKTDSPLKEFDFLRITDSTDIPTPIPIISINGEIISTEGNITTISGASKSGKSSFTNIIIAGAISQNGKIDGLEALKVESNKFGKAVLHFDTEQSRYDHQSNLKAILRRCNLKESPDFFQSYNIRRLELDKFIVVTKKICELAFKQFEGIHLIVIDGGADYISDVNDSIQSNALVKEFEELAIEYSTPIVVIIHTNPGGDKERGHLGSQFQRKSESLLTVRSVRDISTVEPKLLRKAGKINIPQIHFSYDAEKGYHIECDMVYEQKETGLNRMENIKQICLNMFSDQKAYKYGDAISEMQNTTGKKETAVKGYMSEMIRTQMIIQGGDKKWRLNE